MTTLAYVAFWDWGSGREVVGAEWIAVVLAVLIDLGAHDRGRRAR